MKEMTPTPTSTPRHSLEEEDSVTRRWVDSFGSTGGEKLEFKIILPLKGVGTSSELCEAMPSRKKTKGQARKAARVKREEALLAEKVRKDEELFRGFQQVQIQRLQINNQSSVLPLCMHGFDPFPDDHVCSKFIRAFVHEFYKRARKVYTAGKQDERAVIECLLDARDSTQDEHSEVWNDAAKMKQVISYFLHSGTMSILDELFGNAITSALFARFFEQWLKARVHKSQACINWPKVIEFGLVQSDGHTLVKYFWRRIRCSCLDEKYEEVKSITKIGICFNKYCTHPKRTVERSELRCCSRCRSVTYCSRECQAADWSEHKELCDEVVATRAEFEASQKQQS
jgi:hypothetical protein